MGRPPLPVGTYGKIRAYQTAAGWRARTKYRDADGMTRPMERTGNTEAAAVRNLKTALRHRSAPTGASITADNRFRDVAEKWYATVQAAADQARRSPWTVEQYRGHLDRTVLPALGALRLRELTVARLDAFLTAVRQNTGTATAKPAARSFPACWASRSATTQSPPTRLGTSAGSRAAGGRLPGR